ncbi:hypothetical protein [Prosthecobacter fusiformis]|uniref:hypothetical protein n=1 Tax=Prosthecobacter fusiformis TaxID=48464 RepID=UPI00105F3BA4|nr:hypothetical protein [Prosthecobacter fusiformis]
MTDEIRRRAGEYFASGSFDQHFVQLHGHSRITLILAGIFLPLFLQFSASAGAWRKLFSGDLFTPGLRRRYIRLAKKGEFIFTYVVICNEELKYTPGVVAPALVIGNFNEGRDDRQMLKMRARVADLALGRAAEPHEQKIAKLLGDQDYCFQRRRHFNAGGVKVIAFDLMVLGEFLPTKTLQIEVIPCLAEPGRNGLIAMIPHSLVADLIDF